ncbi:hypothetical protein K3N28_13275 [Glycomyces sp. TRM65418]|uniref:hypothetical protein n=1 Tax=Glycomyces sp. TRM65418 TaxID=2867006 RepID=UPI001CE5CD3C|nr:hypothetical protein [Glycomyces sp. TRM65418]MCC3764036.1 hypothetical protein [Glycomyces sp. TRM65418]QZD53727.1 hypothetical protein K3N28_13210 [Glycomyces sp. TRM65418]
MSRTVGPYEDVATVRVEGAYELCDGRDENGRPVQILTLGATSSKDPARRGLLSDTVAWAYATAGPEDAPILVADLDAEQPYVVVLRDARLRGADRIMDRLLALGPATGPLPVGPAAAAQRAAHQLAAAQRSAAPASPGGPTSPPMSPAATSGHGAFQSPPVVMIAPPKKRSQVKPILIGIGSVVVILALVVGVWAVLSNTDSDESGDSVTQVPDNAAVDEVSQPPAEEGEEADAGDEVPQWDPEAPEERVGGSLFEEGDAVSTIAYQNWPFAFRIPDDFECAENGRTTVCTAEDDSRITIGWEDCSGECPRAVREALREALPYQPLVELGNGEVAYAERTQVYGRWRGSLSVFATGPQGAFHAWASADVTTERTDQGWQVFNDVLNQAFAKAEQ